MKTRIDILKAEPQALQAMYGLEKYLQSTELSHAHNELIKIRTSQINGCAYCLDMHTRDARKYGETEQRIYLLNAWREAGLFSKEEQAILALTEEVTLISKGGVSDETYEKALELPGEKYLNQVIVAIVVINGWNRIAISTRKEIG
ncbi:carboxymuconolactone decarboxylase family protein [Arcticibacter sp. MXS-1]|uniref:carboxymuconolactone decarboxylase family protein n=1 Tax=Arcticibacter sp. MXS-1 TaxID=3341726 RepID=UPI0035A8C346